MYKKNFLIKCQFSTVKVNIIGTKPEKRIRQRKQTAVANLQISIADILVN